MSMSEARSPASRLNSLQDPRVLALIKAAEDGVSRDTGDEYDAMSADELELVIEALRAGRSLEDLESEGTERVGIQLGRERGGGRGGSRVHPGQDPQGS